MITYHMRLSSLGWVGFKAPSASDAIQRALSTFPDNTVCECYSGYKEDHIVYTPQGSYKDGPQWIDYEVPRHTPYVQPSHQPGSPQTETFGFFDEIPVIKPAHKLRRKKVSR